MALALVSASLRSPVSRELRWSKESLWWVLPARMPSQRLGANSSAPRRTAELALRRKKSLLNARGSLKSLMSGHCSPRPFWLSRFSYPGKHV